MSVCPLPQRWAGGDFAQLADCGVIVICCPAPLNIQREPDLLYVEWTARLPPIRQH